MSSISMDNLRNFLPFSVILYTCVPSSYTIIPLSSRSERYSFNWVYDKYALYIILVFVVPTVTESRIIEIISVRLRYFMYKRGTYCYKNSSSYFYGTMFYFTCTIVLEIFMHIMICTKSKYFLCMWN